MAFRLLEITKPEELQEWTPVFWEANSNPPMSGHNALMPVKGDTLSAKTAAIEDAKQRYIGMLEHDPDAHLLKVIDINNAVLGGGYWEIYETNPFANPPPNFEIYWWPEGSDSRKFVEMMFMQRGASRVQRQQRPHIQLSSCFTLPEFRRRGIASLVMNWGTQKADELGLDCFVESTEIAVPLYKKYGFVTVDHFSLDASIPNASEEWKTISARNLPMEFEMMWRPAKGKFQEGDKYPWE